MMRWWMFFGAAMATVIFLFGGAVDAADSVAKTKRPNIIVILCDDMGFSDLGCYGSEIKTPNLDGLAANGLRFTQFYNTARCCPTRASLLTGLYPHQAGVGHMTNANSQLDGYVGNLNKQCITIAQALKPAGYATYMVGKWHVTKHDKPAGPKDDWPIQRGFDRFYGTIVGGGSFFDPGMLTRDNTPISPFQDKEYQPPQGEPYYYTNALSDQASRFITEHKQKNADQPFFCYVAYTAAHWPMHALDRDIAKYKGKYDAGYAPIRKARFEKEKQLGLIDPKWDLSPQAGDWDKVKNKAWEARCMEVYAAMIDNMDQGVGRIVDSLRKTGELDNTLILFLQDNGGNYETTGRVGVGQPRPAAATLPVLGPDFIETAVIPKRTRDGFPVRQGEGVLPGGPDTYVAYGRGWANVSNVPFREYKHFVHEGGISTPLVAHWPIGITRKGELEKQPGHLIDIMATCLELSGAQYPKRFNGQDLTPPEGRSLVPAFAGKPIERDAIYWEHEGNRAVRQGKWKLVAKAPDGPWELYDMEADRTEMHDLSATQPQLKKELIAKWEAYATRTHAIPWIWKPQYGEPATQPSTQPAAPRAFKGTYDLKAGDDLPKAQAPQVKGRPITIDAEITKVGDGVIVAQGGVAEGFTLYVKQGRATFALRRASQLTAITGKDPLPSGSVRLQAKLSKDGKLTLTLDGKEIATGAAAGTLTKMPIDGLQVGRDGAGAVGDYETPFAFSGTIGRVTVKLTE
jgi:arylsulfatase